MIVFVRTIERMLIYYYYHISLMTFQQYLLAMKIMRETFDDMNDFYNRHYRPNIIPIPIRINWIINVVTHKD